MPKPRPRATRFPRVTNPAATAALGAHLSLDAPPTFPLDGFIREAYRETMTLAAQLADYELADYLRSRGYRVEKLHPADPEGYQGRGKHAYREHPGLH